RALDVPLRLDGDFNAAGFRAPVLDLRLEAHLVAPAVVPLALLVQDERLGGPADVDRDREALQRDAGTDRDGPVPVHGVGGGLLEVEGDRRLFGDRRGDRRGIDDLTQLGLWHAEDAL